MTIESTLGQGPQSDQELVQYTLEGDRNAYRVLVERYQARLLTMAFNILKNREDAEDVVQESFVKGFLSLKYFKGHSSFYTWLYRITFNMAVDVKRRTIRRGVSILNLRSPGASILTGPVLDRGLLHPPSPKT